MSRLTGARIVSLSIAAILVATGVPARAEDPEALIKQGVELRRRGEDARAEGYIRRAYQLAATPRTAAQLGLVELAVSEYLEADSHLTEALKAKDAWVNEHRQALEASRATARKHLLRVEITSAPRGTRFASESTEPASLPADGVIFLAPGVGASIQLEAEGHKSAVVHVEGAPGETKRIAIDMPALTEGAATTTSAAPTTSPATSPTAPSASATAGTTATTTSGPSPTAEAPVADASQTAGSARPAAPGGGVRIAGITVGAVGVAVSVVGAVLLSQGLSKRDAYNAAIQSKGKTQYDPSFATWTTLRDEGIACLVGGGVAIAAGVGTYLYGRQLEHDGGTSVSFLPGSGFGVFTYRRTF
jgi:hypothetical protein